VLCLPLHPNQPVVACQKAQTLGASLVLGNFIKSVTSMQDSHNVEAGNFLLQIQLIVFCIG